MKITKHCRAHVIVHVASSIAMYASLASNASSYATETTWNFAGELRQYYDINNHILTPMPPPELAAVGLVPGAILNAQVTYNLSVSDADPMPDRGQYAPVTAAHMIVGELDMQFDQGINLTVIETSAPPGVSIGMSSSFGLGDSHGLNVLLGALELIDASGKQFKTDALLPQPPSLSSLDAFDPTNPPFATRALLGIAIGSLPWEVQFELTNLHTVPEPSALALAIGGLMIATPLRRRRTSQNRV